MLSRWLLRTSNLRSVSRFSSTKSLPHPPPLLPKPNPNPTFVSPTPRYFSTNRGGDGDNFGRDPPLPGSWKLSPDQDDDFIFNDTSDLADENLELGDKPVNVDSWGNEPASASGDTFDNMNKEIETESKTSSGGDDAWLTAEGYKPWDLKEDAGTDIFDFGQGTEGLPYVHDEAAEREKSEADKQREKERKEADEQLEKEKSELTVRLKGPNRAFGDLIAVSGITDAMLDSLIALKDLEALEGLPPLSEVEDIRLAKSEIKNTRAEIERQKQEEIAKSRVRQVDDKGRAYGTGRRKCSVARVFIQPGDGKFTINDKPVDVYFPILDHRADVLRPFSETKTLGLWDVLCTVKGGGVSGQVGAVRLGISRALQNWEPGLRPNLRAAGFLTRDPRMVERKKPGKAKARKSFQWVKR